jgi:acylglycerol lipase
MKHTYTLLNRDNMNLYNVAWETESTKATILMVHGYAEHIERYNYEADYFKRNGFAVFGYDHRAHGRSDGKDAFMKSIDDLSEDLREVINYLKPKTPLYIYAHSMGGLVTVKYLLDHQQPGDQNISGILLTGALLKVASDLSPLLQKVSGILGRLAPKLKTVKLPIEGISEVPEVRTAYLNDPYVYQGGTYAASGSAMLQAIKSVTNRFDKITIPFLAMHGGGDIIVEKTGTIKLFDNASSTDKQLKIWDGLAHEITRSYEKDAVLQTMVDWLDARVK